MEDSAIVALYWQREERAIAETYQKYGRFCHQIARNILTIREDAEECVSDTWVKAWNTMPPQRPNSLKAFLGCIVRNLAISRYRSSRAQKRYGGMEILLSELDDCVPTADEVANAVDAAELSQAISDWLRTLPLVERTWFIRRYWNGEPVKNLALEQGMASRAMTKRLARLRAGLRAHLEKEGIGL